MMNANRIRDIDFWRGAVLIVILVDHIPGNPLENLTPRNFGLSDSAEAFIFLSGLSIGLIYMPRARKYGLEPVAGGLLRRALKLYGVHIALTLAALLVFGAAYWISGVTDLIEAHGRSFVFGSPSSGLLGLALMSHAARLFQHPAALCCSHAVGAGRARHCAARPDARPRRLGRRSMRPRASSASTCRTGRRPEAGSSIRSPGNSCSRSGLSRRSYGATVRRGPLRGSSPSVWRPSRARR